jgi:coproporphyrinogen III oxidase
MVLAGLSPAAAESVRDTRLERLSPEHQALARRMVDFMAASDARFFARVASLNRSADALPVPDDTLQRETDDSLYDVRVIRGPVVEKFGRMIAEGKKTQPGRREGELVWSRFYSLDAHPRTPFVGMLHATLVLQFYADGSGFAGGWLGVMNGTRVDEDMQKLTALVDEHFAAYEKSPAVYRGLMVKGTDETITEFRRRPDPAGVSFYGPPLFPRDLARSYDLIETLFLQFTDAYLDLVAARDPQPFALEDLLRQQEMRKRWLVDQLFSDPFARDLVPFEVWSLANVPPTVNF